MSTCDLSIKLKKRSTRSYLPGEMIEGLCKAGANWRGHVISGQSRCVGAVLSGNGIEFKRITGKDRFCWLVARI